MIDCTVCDAIVIGRIPPGPVVAHCQFAAAALPVRGSPSLSHYSFSWPHPPSDSVSVIGVRAFILPLGKLLSTYLPTSSHMTSSISKKISEVETREHSTSRLSLLALFHFCLNTFENIWSSFDFDRPCCWSLSALFR